VPKISSTTVSMTLKTTLGAYKVYQAVVKVGDGVTQVPLGASTFQVKLGTTQASAKLDPFNWPLCTNVDMKTC
jgi:hypothetical protein